MTVVVFEGLNGVGKSTYAGILSAAMETPMYRPFRRNPDNHWDGVEAEALKALNVPFNTYVEDMFTADALVQLGVSAILDRSMPSALVYARVDGADYVPGFQHLDWWQSILSEHPAGVLVVQLEAPLGAIQERLGDRAPPAERCEALARAYSKTFQRINLPKMVIDTTRYEPADGVGRIIRRLIKA